MYFFCLVTMICHGNVSFAYDFSALDPQSTPWHAPLSLDPTSRESETPSQPNFNSFNSTEVNKSPGESKIPVKTLDLSTAPSPYMGNVPMMLDPAKQSFIGFSVKLPTPKKEEEKSADDDEGVNKALPNP